VRIVKVLLIIILFGLNQYLFAAAPVFGSAKETNYARSLKPPKGKSLIYIYQRPQSGGEVSPLITLNKYNIGRIVPGSFTVWQLAPGRRELNVAGSQPANMVLRSTAGKIYLFRVNVTRTESGTRAVLESLPVSYRGELAACRLIKNPRNISAPELAPMPQRQAKAPAAETKPPQARHEKKARHTAGRRSPTVGGLSLQIKTGSLSVANGTQTILSQDRLFDKSTSGLLGLGIDYQSSSGLSLGGEILNYKAHFVTSGLNDSHEVNVYALLANAKQYYLTDSVFQPYLGVGIGVAVTSISGPSIRGNTAGLAYQLLAGMEYRYANLGFFAEAKYLGANTRDSNNQNVDVSGSGIFAGVSFHY